MRAQLRRVDPSLLGLISEGFLSRLSFGLISFAVPLYAFRLGLSLVEIGFLASLNTIVAVVLKPVMGWVADRWGLKPSLVVAITVRSLVSVCLVFATTPWHLFAVRGLHGVSIALRDPAVNALIAEHGGKKAVASSFAWYQTAKSLAGALGKTVAGLLLTLTASSFSSVFFVAFLLSSLPLVVVARHVKENAESADKVSAGEANLIEAAADQAPLADQPSHGPATLPFMVLGFLISSTALMLGNLFPILATEYAGLSEAAAGSVYLFTIVFILSGPFFGWLSDHVSRKLVLFLRSAANTVSSLVYLLAPNLAGIAVGKALDDMGKAAFRPAWGALMAHVASFDRRRRARTMSKMSMGEDVGEMIGPIVAGFLWSTWGVAVVLLTRVGMALVAELYTVHLTRMLGKAEKEGVGTSWASVKARSPEAETAALVHSEP